MKTRIMTTHKNGGKKKKGNKHWHKAQTRKVHRKHGGAKGMKRMVMSHNAPKRGRKR